MVLLGEFLNFYVYSPTSIIQTSIIRTLRLSKPFCINNDDVKLGCYGHKHINMSN